MKQKDIIILIVPSFILIIAWIIFSIYHNSVNSTISSALNIQITPIKSTFDTSTISKLKQRQSVTPTYQITGFETPTPTPGVFGVPISSSSSQVNPSNNPPSTPGGGLTP